jgi:hypothetical protein
MSSDMETLRIKKGDLIIHIKGGSVSRVCKSCGSWNSIEHTPTIKVNTGKEVIKNAI